MTTGQVDPHYTPTWLADEIANLLPRGVTSAVDLAAGGGALLEAVERRFGDSVFIAASDIDRRAARHLRREHPDWSVSTGDALSDHSRRATRAFRDQQGRYDVVVLNPPFSYRGGARRQISLEGKSHLVTPATAFMAQALKWVHREGVVLAIVPANVMNLRSDSALWERWASAHEVEVVRELDRYTFPACRTTTWIVRIKVAQGRRAMSSPSLVGSLDPATSMGSECRCLEIVRGRVPVFRATGLKSDTGTTFVHSTHLVEGVVRLEGPLVATSMATAGPLLLFPRVGLPKATKLAIHDGGSIVLSDCVLALRSPEIGLLHDLRRVIVKHFDEFASLYIGSCAPYVTLSRLSKWLGARGLTAAHSAASASPLDCVGGCRQLEIEAAS